MADNDNKSKDEVRAEKKLRKEIGKDKNIRKNIQDSMPSSSPEQVDKMVERMIDKLTKEELSSRAERDKQLTADRDQRRQDDLTSKIAMSKGISDTMAASLAEQQIKQEKSERKKSKGLKKLFFSIKDNFNKTPEEKKEEADRQSGLFKGLKKVISGMGKGAKVGGGIFGGIMKTIKKVFGLLKLKFLFIGALVIGMISQLNLGQLKKIWEGLKEAFTAIYDFVEPIVKYIWNWIKESVLPNLVQFFIDTIKTIGETFKKVKEIFKGWGEMSFMEKVGAVFTALWEVVKSLGTIALNIVAKIGAMFGLDGEFFMGIWENIKKIPSFMGDLITDAVNWFKTLFDFSSMRTTIESLINMTQIVPNIIKKFLLDPAVTWLGKKFNFDSSKFTDFNIGELVMNGFDKAVGWLEEKLDFKMPEFSMPEFNLVQGFKDMIRPLLEKASIIIPNDLLAWARAKPKKVEKPPEPPKTGQLKKSQWAQREATEWARKTKSNPSDWTKAMGGKGKVKEMYGSYKSGDMAEPSKMATSKSELDQIKKDEGFSRSVYKDTMGIKTIGYGFNLEREGAQEALDAAGIKKGVAFLKNGRMKLTEEEASRLMMGEMGHFRNVAKRYVGEETWKNLSSNRQGILTNMAYNMGEGTLSKFKDLKAAIVKGDWKQAQVEMKDSNWSKQVKGRSDRLIARMGQNDSGQKLASAQLASSTMAKTSSAPVVITKNNSSSNSNTSYTTHPSTRDTSIEIINATAHA